MIILRLRPARTLTDLLLHRSRGQHDIIRDLNCSKTLIARLATDKPYGPIGLDKIRAVGDGLEEEQNKCMYPMLKQLGIATDGRTHSFSLSSDTVIKYIKLGAINKNLAMQYCCYLAHLCRNSSPADLDYYSVRVANLTQYILKHHKELPHGIKTELLVEVASSSEAICSMVCSLFINEQEPSSDMLLSSLSGLLSACYKFKLWDTASKLMEKPHVKGFNWTTFDVFITSMGEFLNSDNSSAEEKVSLKNHIQILFKFTRERRIQFVTKQPDLLVQCLESLMPCVYKRPVFKMSGRCTHCNTHIPLYDNKDVSQINKSIKEVLDKRHMGNLQIYSTKSDIQNFYRFLENLYEKDKKPIDCVIDGLNLAFKNTHGHIYSKQKFSEECEKTVKRQDPQFQVQVLANAIIRSNLLDRFRKILVIGRNHMKRWPGLLEFFNKNNIYFYASDNSAKEDLFMLYASTLYPKTVLVTNDFLRDHLALLEGESRTQLERYIDTHQVWIENKTLKAIWPTPFEKLPYADETCSHIHIPVIDYNKIDLLAQQEPPPHLNSKITTWLCCSSKKNIIEEKPQAPDKEFASDRATEAN